MTGREKRKLVMDIARRLADEIVRNKREIGEPLLDEKGNPYPSGPAPFGWSSPIRIPGEERTRKPLRENAFEQAIIARIRELRAKGKTFEYIARRLNNEDYRTRRGGKWVAQSVHRVFVNAKAFEREPEKVA